VEADVERFIPNLRAAMTRALICGVSGQDGAYLSQLLLAKGYEVFGASRDAQVASFRNLEALGVKGQVKPVSITITDFRSVLQAITRIVPDEIYNLAGQSSVGLSFEQPVETLESITIGTLNLLEAIRFSRAPIRMYSAGSGECFGDTKAEPANEAAAFRPRSPYAVAKAGAYWQVANYREAYDMYACTGILFNHESPLRPRRFVTRKIVTAAVGIAQGSGETLALGNLDVHRDWGWAPEYVDAMWRMLQRPVAEDFVVATGCTHSLREFVDEAFRCVGLNWQEHVVVDPNLLRPTDIMTVRADPRKAETVLGWKAQAQMPEVVRRMIEAEKAAHGAS
jgi:GDPmannose 4,6-dehydratase